MRKLSVVLVIVALLGMSAVAAAGEYQKSDNQNAIIKQAQQKTGKALVVGNTGYVKEVYTTTVPSGGDLYNQAAIKVFPYGITVHMLVRFYLTGTDAYTTYVIVTNAGGDTLYLNSISSSGHNPVNEFTWTPPTTGAYFLTALIFDGSTGEMLTPTTPFPFIVE